MAEASNQNSSPLNKEAALSVCDGDEELFKELIGIFLEDSVGVADKLKQAVESGDAEAVHQNAHALKGASGNICAGPVRDAAQLLEKAGRNNDLQQAPALHKKLEQEFQKLINHIRQILSSS